MPIDKELIIRKMALIEKDLKALFQTQKLKQNEWSVFAAERLFERIIGRMIDINFHLVSEIKEVVPKTYYESFILLGEMKILSEHFVLELAPLSGLRNRLAHEYNNLDEKKIAEAIHKYPKPILDYLKAIRKFMGK